MRIDALAVVLRPRSSWEAIELGSALVRANARAVWAPWLMLTAPLYVLALLAGQLLLDSPMWGMLLFWWLLPAFDRIPLYVLSRAVFGAVPTPRQTLRAQLHWGLRHLPGLLLWRRLTPRRPVAMSIDLLEGVRGAQRAARMRLVAGGTWASAMALTAMCALFVLVLHAGVVSLVIAFDPTFLGVDPFTTLERVRDYLFALMGPAEEPNHAVRVAWYAGYYVALTIVQPYFVGGGFGLYLNRRTDLEAWDLEIAFRRLRRRLGGAVGALVAVGLALALLVPAPARASAPPDAPARAEATADAAPRAPGTRKARRGNRPPVTPFERIFPAAAPSGALEDGLARAREHPDLNPKRRETRLEARPRLPPEDRARSPDQPTWLESVMDVFTFFGKHGLVILLVVVLILLALRWRRWWPWLSGLVRDPEAAPAVVATAAPEGAPMPDDVVAAARAHWRAGDARAALAVLYRASADAVAERAGVVMVPGATEAEYLRVARRLGDVAARSGFQRMVRAWQYAAYAHRIPQDDEFEALVGELAPAFGWRA